MYGSTLGDREYRLIRLFPDESEAPVRCELFKASLDQGQSITYEAISYVWGDPSMTQTICCNGRAFEVTSSLASALHQFRYSDVSRILWADALCIDQNNPVERSYQVQLMGELYGKAACVLAWLGPNNSDEADLHTAFLAMEYIADLYYGAVMVDPPFPRCRSPMNLVFCSFRSLVDTFVNLGHGDPFPSLLAFLERTYWERVWCIQEAHLARDLYICSGSLKISAERAAVLPSWYVGQMYRERGWINPRIGSRLLLCGVTLDFHNVLTPPEFRWHEDILIMARICQQHKATDKRDRIFGLLGLKYVPPVPFKVDYGNSFDIVYREFAKDMIRQKENLNILAYVQVNEIERDERFPSWVPRWDISSSWFPFTQAAYLPSNLKTERFPTGNLDLSSVDFMSDRVLAVPGILFDKIADMSDQMMDSTTESSYHDFLDTDVVAKTWFTRYLAEYRELTCLNEPELCGPALHRLATTFTGGGTGIGSNKMVSSRLEELDPMTEIGQRFIKDFWAHVDKCPNSIEPDLDGQTYRHMAFVACHLRRFFTTNGGYIGVGPPSMKVGDIIAVLHGGLYPFILRKTDGMGDEYTLVGGE